MQPLFTAPVMVGTTRKEISVFCGDITAFPEPIDILITSAYHRSYSPVPGTVFHALQRIGIHIAQLALRPQIDLRSLCDVWLSHSIPGAPIGRIACVEFGGWQSFACDLSQAEQALLHSIQSLFRMLDIAAIYGIQMDTVALPLLGSGRQNIAGELTMIPMLNECISFLERNDAVKRILFVEYNPQKAEFICSALRASYQLQQHEQGSPKSAPAQAHQLAFISYSSPDKNIADSLCAKLEQNGMPVWYAPRDVKGPYAGAITDAIEKATHFIVILSQNSIASQHVLNEIDLAFQKLPNGVKFKPLRIDEAMFTPSFKYYLSRQHWMTAAPPLEERLSEFVASVLADL